MRLFCNNIFVVVGLFFSLPYILADDDDDVRLVAVRTLLFAPDGISASLLQEIDVGMDSITDSEDRRQRLLAEDIDNMDPHSRHLRSGDKERKLRCSRCLYYPSYYSGCWVKYVWTPRCRRRHLIFHKKLTEEAIAKLNDKELRRYLQTSTACDQAIQDMDDDIDDAMARGIVPPLPENVTFVEECIFEEIDDNDD